MLGRRHVAALAVAALVVATTGVVGVRVADPAGTDGARDLDLSAPPGEVAIRALEQTERGDYTVTRWQSRWTSDVAPRRDGLTLVYRLRVSNTRGRLFLNGSDFNSHVHLYGNGHCRWSRRYDPVDSVRSDWFRECGHLFWPVTVRSLFSERAVANASVTVLARNRSTLVLRVDDAEAATATAPVHVDTEEWNARLTLYVDRDASRLRRVVYERWNRTNASDRARRVFVFRNWGNTRVHRPGGAAYTFEEFLFDVMDTGRTAVD